MGTKMEVETITNFLRSGIKSKLSNVDHDGLRKIFIE